MDEDIIEVQTLQLLLVDITPVSETTKQQCKLYPAERAPSSKADHLLANTLARPSMRMETAAYTIPRGQEHSSIDPNHLGD